MKGLLKKESLRELRESRVSPWITPGMIYSRQEVIEAVCRHFKVSLALLQTSCRKHAIVFPRMILSFLLYTRCYPEFTSYEIADLLKQKDSTIRYYNKDIREKIEIGDEQVASTLKEIQEKYLDLIVNDPDHVYALYKAGRT